MKYFLITEYNNWADEFDLEKFTIWKANSEEEVKKEILENFLDGEEFPKEVYFGTNESIEIEDEKSLFDCLEIIEITKSNADVITRLLGDSFGLGVII